MLSGLCLLKYVVPFVDNRITSIFITALYSIVGASIYFAVTYKTKAIHEVFGSNIFEVIKKKLKLTK